MAEVSRRRSALATLAGSTASTAVAAVQSLVLLPLYLSVVGPTLYGAWLATGEVLVWLLAFDFGVPNLLIQRVGAHLAKGEKREIGAHFTTSLVALGGIAFLLVAVVFALAPVIASAFGIEGRAAIELTSALRLGVFATGLMLLAYGFHGLARGLQDTSLVQGVSLAGTVVGFALTTVLLLTGQGLEAIAYGLIARSGFALAGGLVFVYTRVDDEIVESLRPTREATQDIAKNCPPMFVAGIGYALMNNSMVTLSAVMLRPDAAVVLGVTKKAADLVKMVLDMLGHASYGGFAHLYSQNDGRKTIGVYKELQSSFFLVATSLLAAYVAVNAVLIENWVGSDLYGGFALTFALALATVASSWSYLQIGLYRSMGHHSSSSLVLITECAVRLAAMVVAAALFGVVGLAMAAAVSAVASGVWATVRIRELLGQREDETVWMWRTLLFLGATAVGYVGVSGGWMLVCAVGVLVFVAASVLLLFADPALHGLRQRLIGGRA